MSNFNPYNNWFGIPKNEASRNYYQILGLSSGESDPVVIESATEQRLLFLKSVQNGPDGFAAQRIANEVTPRSCEFTGSRKKRFTIRSFPVKKRFLRFRSRRRFQKLQLRQKPFQPSPDQSSCFRCLNISSFSRSTPPPTSNLSAKTNTKGELQTSNDVSTEDTEGLVRRPKGAPEKGIEADSLCIGNAITPLSAHKKSLVENQAFIASNCYATAWLEFTSFEALLACRLCEPKSQPFSIANKLLTCASNLCKDQSRPTNS